MVSDQQKAQAADRGAEEAKRFWGDVVPSAMRDASLDIQAKLIDEGWFTPEIREQRGLDSILDYIKDLGFTKDDLNKLWSQDHAQEHQKEKERQAELE